jgi:hypothetical protein
MITLCRQCAVVSTNGIAMADVAESMTVRRIQ